MTPEETLGTVGNAVSLALTLIGLAKNLLTTVAGYHNNNVSVEEVQGEIELTRDLVKQASDADWAIVRGEKT